jgi:small multidrug resistance pump
MGWVFLAGAILFEVAGTLSLRMATHGRAIWYLPVIVAYLIAFTLLALTLADGVPLSAAYGTWTAVGVALTALAGRILFKESLTWLMGLGVALIVGGVLLIEFGH